MRSAHLNQLTRTAKSGQVSKMPTPVEQISIPSVTCNVSPLDRFQGECNLLFHASMDNNMAALEVLLAHGANPAKRNKRGVGLLNMLMKREQTEMATKCVDFMNIHHKQVQLMSFFKTPFASGWTPLMTAAENGR